MDALVDLNKERLTASDVLIRQKECIAKAYNKKFKSEVILVGDYVWKVILPMYQIDKALGEWSPNWDEPFKINQVFE